MKKIFSTGFLALIMLAACSASSVNQKGTGQPVTQPVADAEAGVNDDPVSQFGTNMKCEMLKSMERRQECLAQINDSIGAMLEGEILSTFDVNRCKELPEERADRCQNRLAEAGVQGPVSDDELVLFNGIVRGEPTENEEGIVSIIHDSGRCSELKTIGYKEYCENRIAERLERDKFDEIRRSDDSTRCDELQLETVKNECRQFFGIEAVEETVAADVLPEGTGEEVVQ